MNTKIQRMLARAVDGTFYGSLIGSVLGIVGGIVLLFTVFVTLETDSAELPWAIVEFALAGVIVGVVLGGSLGALIGAIWGLLRVR